ncbi:MAG TPA: Stk1 family PASTA domain-containing Ser/Thr kinase [Candidatus Avoscillospira avicola]|uniref:non-specific serine/threonine protein kinase n=1 Tax=Candidatus Avoscillospira avicola TaxID=2840706 RepID=A0A9D1DHD6_9FIRM|nr:Stk1 family PASTA domain-containing Ser/Thr kinase [Candidatus Avoscillospira avicola]
MENYIGRLLDHRYEILEVIGTGGMAVVYKARCHRLNRLVAIKILKDELSEDAEFRRRFHAESQAVAMLSHPNIVNVYDVSHSDNVDYIVMELIDGITLKQYMEQKGVLNWREALHFSTQIAKALEHAHSRGIIHRDIKPHNIMVLKDGSVKVADFGIARVSSAQSTLTREALGSVHYISPEQAKGGRIDYRSDLYSLGVVMYEMLTGHPPYDGETPVSVAIQHINAKAIPPRVLNPQIPEGLEQITMHAMAADLEDRYESATQMLQDLDEFRKNPAITFRFDGEPEAPRPQERAGQPRSAAERAVRGKSDTSRRHPVQPQKKRRGNAVALITGFIVIALALAGIGFFLYSFFFADFLTSTDDVPVPNLVGLYAEDIQQSDYPNFQIRVEDWVPDDTVEQGRVISQTPVADRLVKSGTTISLTVSSGPSTDTMRDLLNDTLENAQTILDNLALDLQVKVEYESSDLGEGTVIRTDPVKGTALTAGQTVTLYVSSGPAVKLVPVPELVGLTEEQAIEKLESRNLKYEITRLDREEALGTVVFQSIKQGEEVKEGTTVNLQVSNGPEKDPLDPDADEEDDENTEGNEPPQMLQDRLIYIKLPSGLTEELEITVKMDDVTIDSWTLDPETLNDQNETSIMLSGVGIHRIDVYIDGLLYYTMDYDFDTGEELS